MASAVCNYAPGAIKKPRNFELNDHKKSLLMALDENNDEPENTVADPEITCFVLENSGDLKPEFFSHPSFKKFRKNLAKCLDNGLIIDRVSDFFSTLIDGGMDAGEALYKTCEIFVAIYGGDKKPWWFKENASFHKIFDKEEDIKEGVSLAEELARESGFAFPYMVQIYKKAGYKLEAVAGIGRQEAITFCNKIAVAYGIGNIPRACSIINFALAVVNDAEDPVKLAALKGFEDYVLYQKPASEIAGRMEGEEATITFPGIFSMMVKGIGRERAREEKLDESTLTPAHLVDLTHHLARPLIERAKTQPTLSAPLPKHKLLAANLEGRLALPVAEEKRDLAVSRPLPGVFAFYARLKEECGHIDDSVADIYFLFFADKMPDPFNPPKGFLKFVQKFGNVPTRGNRFVGLEHPNKREQLRRSNAERAVNKNLVVANILDAWILGFMNDEELFDILNWMVGDADEATRAKIIKRFDDNEEEGKKRMAAERALHPEDYKDWHEDDEVSPDKQKKYRRRRIKDEIRDYEVKLRQARIEMSRVAVDQLVGINFFVALGILDKSDVQLVFSDIVNNLKTSEPQISERHSQSHDDDEDDEGQYGSDDLKNQNAEHWDGKFMAAIQEMRDCQVIDMEIFKEHFRSTDNKARAFSELHRAVTGFMESLRIIKETENSFRRNDYKETAYTDTLERLDTRLNSIVKDSPCFVNPNAVSILINKYFTLDRYIYLSLILSDLRKRAMEQVRSRPWNASNEEKAVNEVSAATMSIVASVLALKMQMGEDINVVKALPSKEVKTPEETHVGAYGTPGVVAKQLLDILIRIIPALKEQVVEVRRDSFGLLPVGGKVHILHAVDIKKFDAFRDLIGLKHTAFKLDRAETSVILPAVPSAKELKLVVSALEAFGIIDGEFPELQVSLPGRLDPRDAAILGSAILLSTEKGVEYDENAFLTNQNDATGKRIMSYDAAGGYPLTRLPFMTDLEGRTDMLGRRSLEDIELIQLLGTVLIQAKAKSGPFAKFAEEFKRKYLEILKKYDLSSVIEGSWIFRPHADVLNDDEANKNHYKTVKKCTDEYFKCAEEYMENGEERGVIFEMRALFDWLRAEVKDVQNEVYFSAEGGQPCAEAKILLQL
jgi:hypothetical protein